MGAELVALDEEVTGFAMAVARDEITADECAEFLDRRVIRFRWSGSYRALRLSRLADYDLQQMSRTLDEWNQSGTHRFVRILRAMEDIRANVDG